MLIVVDVGNSNITLGLYDDQRLCHCWRMETVATRTDDEYALLLKLLLQEAGHPNSVVDGVIIASVVPALTRTMEKLTARLFGVAPLVVGPDLTTGMPVLYNSPKDVGADRIVNGVAAFARFKAACIVVDFGTATTFDAITANGEYAGGAIAPGISISMDALFRRTAKLPRAEFTRPDQVIGRSTMESIQAGTYFGYVGLVDGVVRRMLTELGARPEHVVATGGLAPLIARETATIPEVDETLTLEGLRLLYVLNVDARRARRPAR
ncbi:MAG: type III pantothenate kinase [Deltaproteobacteria bacterium]|nr:type III pantothenate kinase [Deltaproteobacteria bacterium]